MIKTIWAGASEPDLNAAIKRWVADIIWPGQGRELPDAVAMGVVQDGALIGAAIFHDWEPSAGLIEITAAAQSRLWLTRPVLKEMFTYIFDVCGCQMAVMRTSAHERAKHMHRIFTAYGFERVLIKRMYGRNEDGYVWTLTDDAWRANGFHKEI